MTPEQPLTAPGDEAGVVAPASRRGQPRRQVVDPAVSREKFERELAALRRHEPEYRRQGWFLLSGEFPEVFLVLTVPQLNPAPVLFGVVIDFANYNVDPPSVRLVNPWTREPLRAAELLSPLPRLIERQPGAAQMGNVAKPGEPAAGPESPNTPPVVAAETPAQGLAEFGLLMQWWTPESIPFMCMRGVREYHRHPAHTGDAWLLHRGRGEGTLATLLAAIHDHGRAPIQDYTYEFGVQSQRLQHNAFAQQISVCISGFLNVLPGGVLCSWPP